MKITRFSRLNGFKKLEKWIFDPGKTGCKAKTAKYRKSLIGGKLVRTEVSFRNTSLGLALLDEMRRLR